MCYVERQSPLLRSALDDRASHAAATTGEHESHALLNRTWMLAKLLAGAARAVTSTRMICACCSTQPDGSLRSWRRRWSGSQRAQRLNPR
jgi:hypothetical protein